MNPEIHPVDPTGPQLLHEIFEGFARRTPDQIAIEVPPTAGAPRRRFTYAEVDAQANALAAPLAPYVTGESVVAILLPRRDHLIYVAQLAVMKAGGAYTCLERTAPAERLRFVLEDSGAVAAITSEELLGQLGSLAFPAEKTVIASPSAPAQGPPVPAPAWLNP